MTGSCENSNELWVCMKCREFVDVASLTASFSRAPCG